MKENDLIKVLYAELGDRSEFVMFHAILISRLRNPKISDIFRPIDLG